MHQGWMLRIHSKNVFSHIFGTKTVRPLSTAAIGACGQGLGVAEPLIGKPGLHHHAGAIPMRHHVDMVLDLLDEAQRFHVGDDALPRLEAVEAAIGRRHRVVQARVLVEDIDQRQIVAPADLEIVEVVRRRDLDRAGAGRGIGIVVGDDRNAAVDQGQDRVLADEMLVALVVGMHGDAGIAQHGLRPRGGDDDELARRALDRIFEMPEMPLGLDALHLEIGDRGMQFRIPVHQPLVAVDQSVLVQPRRTPCGRRRKVPRPW